MQNVIKRHRTLIKTIKCINTHDIVLIRYYKLAGIEKEIWCVYMHSTDFMGARPMSFVPDCKTYRAK